MSSNAMLPRARGRRGFRLNQRRRDKLPSSAPSIASAVFQAHSSVNSGHRSAGSKSSSSSSVPS